MTTALFIKAVVALCFLTVGWCLQSREDTAGFACFAAFVVGAAGLYLL